MNAPTLQRAIHFWKYGMLYVDARGYYRWSRRAALPSGARSGRIATPYSGLLRRHFTDSSELHKSAENIPDRQHSLFAPIAT